MVGVTGGLKRNSTKRIIIWAALLLLPFATAIICLGFGRYTISAIDILTMFKEVLMGRGENTSDYSVIFNMRMPRIILAMLVGAGLSCAGAAFQGIFSNPLAAPDTLGVASGAAFGAVLAMIMGGNLLSVQLLALVFGLVACLITYNIGRIKGQTSVVMIVLSGVMVSAFFQALVSLVKYTADPEEELPAITYWLMGSMSASTYETLLLGAPFIISGIVIIFSLRWRLNILALNEDEAHAMGINTTIMRLAVIVAASLVTASCVSMCGQVGWVGLLIPHMSRMLMGSDNRMVIPISISLGAAFMLIIDTFARSASASEIPISILTAIIGAPFFIMLLRKTGGSWS